MQCPINFLSDGNPPQLMAISIGLNQAVEIWWDFESARSRYICTITGTISAPSWCMGFVVKKKNCLYLGFGIFSDAVCPVTNCVREQVTILRFYLDRLR